MELQPQVLISVSENGRDIMENGKVIHRLANKWSTFGPYSDEAKLASAEVLMKRLNTDSTRATVEKLIDQKNHHLTEFKKFKDAFTDFKISGGKSRRTRRKCRNARKKSRHARRKSKQLNAIMNYNQ
jgi:hypothetical protein